MAKKKQARPGNKKQEARSAPARPGNKKQALGRGLSALMADVSLSHEIQEAPDTKPQQQVDDRAALTAAAPRGVDSVPTHKLERNPDQPRRIFDKSKLEDLTRSIRDKGVLQPILVRPLPRSYGVKGARIDDRYQIVAGERRWLASVAAGLEFMPVLIRDLSDRDVLEIGVVENVQRTDLNPIEEALAYQALKDQFNRTQEEISSAIGKSRSHVANILRLLSLPELARDYLAQGKISAGHARAILAAPDPQALAERIVRSGLSVRAAEDEVRKQHRGARVHPQEQTANDANSRYIEKQLAEHLGVQVSLKHKNQGGVLSLKYTSLEELETLIDQLKKP